MIQNIPESIIKRKILYENSIEYKNRGGEIMSSILSVNSNFTDYSMNSCSTSSAKTEQKEEEDKKETRKQIITIHEGKFYAKYLVDDNGSKTLLFKVPVEEEDNKNNSGNSKCINDKEKINHLEMIGQYNENIRNASYKIKDEHDNIKDLLKMIS